MMDHEDKYTTISILWDTSTCCSSLSLLAYTISFIFSSLFSVCCWSTVMLAYDQYYSLYSFSRLVSTSKVKAIVCLDYFNLKLGFLFYLNLN